MPTTQCIIRAFRRSDDDSLKFKAGARMGKKSDLGEFEPDVVVGGRLAGLSISKYYYPVVHRSMEIPNMFCEGKCAVDVEEGCGRGIAGWQKSGNSNFKNHTLVFLTRKEKKKSCSLSFTFSTLQEV